jgi:hypothetical protein
MDIILYEGLPVLRFPSYHCDLNPIKPIRTLLKQKIAATDISFGSLMVLKETPQGSLGGKNARRLDGRL